MNRLLIIIALALPSLDLTAKTDTADWRVIPLPQSVRLSADKPFALDVNTQIYCDLNDDDMKRNVAFLAQYICESVGFKPSVAAKKSKGMICLSVDKSLNNKEGYTISVAADGIMISGGSAAGVFYGVQTMRKSLPQTHAEQVVVPSVMIEDAPRFVWRGMMLDCARHFFSVDFVKQYIEMIVLHNMNTFHWHLTDDQGWRIEIKAYPKLTETGAYRSGTVIGNNSDIDDAIPCGGFYTQQEIKDIVEYARERYVTVVPEFDMPGHTLAALASYPALGCTGGPYSVGHKWGIYSDVLCVGNNATYEFVKTTLDEILQLFPSEYIHIGGDETPTAKWEACPKCKAVRLNEGESLQRHFTKEIERFLASKERRMIGWDEVLGCGVGSGATIMAWRGMQAGVRAAETGHDVILTPLTHCYFDYYQTENRNYEPSITGMWAIDVAKVYELEPTPDSLSRDAQSHILGVQANLWTEYIPNKAVAEYMVLPRMAALAEVQWTAPLQKDYSDFKARLTNLVALYDACGWQYASHLFPEKMVKDRWRH